MALVSKANEELDKVGKEGGPTLKQLQEIAEFAVNLLTKLDKLKPAGMDDDGGIAILAAAMGNPAATVDRLQANKEFRAALMAKGWLPPPEKVNHRPNKEQAAERAAYEARKRETPDPEDEAGDSALRRMLDQAGEQP